MKKANLYFMTFFVVLLLLPVTLFAQKKESLAIFTFNGGNASDGEAIASSLSRQATLRNAFNKTTLITRSTIAAMNFEQRFQRNGLTDADTIFELGKALNASHVIAGFITRFGNTNLILISIMDVESLQQIAGDYRTYRSIEEIDKLIPDIAQKLAVKVTRNTNALPGLSVPPFNILSGVDQNEAMVLAQILACELANDNKFAVLPRTESVETVLEEHRRQRSGVTNQERIKLLGAGRNAQYVLSGTIQRLGTLNKFTADILNISDGSFVEGHEEPYTTLSQGLELLPKLAAQLIWKTSLAEIKASDVGVYTINNSKNIQINTDIDFSIFENKIITFQGEGNITFSGAFSIHKNAVIILDNIHFIGEYFNVFDGGKLEMRKDAIISGQINVRTGGNFIMNGGTITNAMGNGVDVSGTFTMNGGNIRGNNDRGVVVNSGGTFIMNNGMIGGFNRNCGVYSSGIFTMNGGDIWRNNVAYFYNDTNFYSDTYLNNDYGGGVHIIGGIFTMNGGTIARNKAKRGGGVRVDGGLFMMNGGEISDNQANFLGGGVYFGNDGKFLKKKGKILSTNRANDGGNIVYGWVRNNDDKKRNSEAGETVTLDSSINGKKGGWE